MLASPATFRKVMAPYRGEVVVACLFTWSWLADLWAQEGIPFVLGHALDMKAIHGGKAKNDTIDAHNIAVLLRGGMRPQVYVYPAALRATRDLLRRRMYWAFSEAAVLFLRDHPAGQKYRTRLEKNHGKGKAWTVLAHQLARAVY